MRILALSNLYPPDVHGGYEIACAQVVEALARRGHEVCVLTSMPGRPLPTVPAVQRVLQLSSIYQANWAVKLAPITRRLTEVQAKFINVHNVHALLTALETFQPHVAFLCNLMGLGGLGLLGCLEYLRVPWVWQLGDAGPRQLCSLIAADSLDFTDLSAPAVPALVGELNRQRCGRYLACSKRLAEEIAAVGIQLDGRLEIVPNWVQGPRPPLRTRYLQDGQLRIVSAGVLLPHKGIDLLLEAAVLLRDHGRDNFVMDFYGADPSNYYRAAIDQLDLRPWVTLKGTRPQAELAPLFADYDICAFPTWAREPFDVLSPLEAAAAGCVPVLSHSCGIAEWLVHDVHCLKAPRTATAFTRVFEDILDRKIDLAPLGRRGSAVVCRDFHLDALLPRMEHTLARAAAQPRAGAGTAAEAYHLALLADRCAQVLAQESLAA